MIRTQQEIKDAFRAIGIQRVEFGNWYAPDGTPIDHKPDEPGYTSNIDLFTANGHVEIESQVGAILVIDHGR